MSTVGPATGPPALPVAGAGAGGSPGSAGRPTAKQQAPAGSGAPQPTSPATLRTPGPWLAATLLPGGAAGAGLAVELRLATAPASAAAFLGRVVAGGNGLALDQGGHLLSISTRLGDLPEGARLPIELRSTATGATVADRAGLERLVTQMRPNAGPLPPAQVAPGTGLAARLLVEWHRSGSAARVDASAEATAWTAASSESVGGWRSLFDLAGAASMAVAPVLLWQRHPEPEERAEEDGAEHLRLVVELSRLGRVSIDLRVDAHTLAASVTSARALDADLRAGIGDVYTAAVELAGRGGSLVFRVNPSAAAGAAGIGPGDDFIV